MDDNYPEDEIVLDPERDRRLRELMELRDADDRPLTPGEGDELDALSGEMARALITRHIEALARERHIPVEEARARVMAATADAALFWEAIVAYPARMAAEVEAARDRRRVKAG